MSNEHATPTPETTTVTYVIERIFPDTWHDWRTYEEYDQDEEQEALARLVLVNSEHLAQCGKVRYRLFEVVTIRREIMDEDHDRTST